MVDKIHHGPSGSAGGPNPFEALSAVAVVAQVASAGQLSIKELTPARALAVALADHFGPTWRSATPLCQHNVRHLP
jgi:hypothetical protein